MFAEADIQGPIMTVESFLGDNEVTFLVACFSTVEQHWLISPVNISEFIDPQGNRWQTSVKTNHNTTWGSFSCKFISCGHFKRRTSNEAGINHSDIQL